MTIVTKRESRSGQAAVEYALMGVVVAFVLASIAADAGGARNVLVDAINSVFVQVTNIIGGQPPPT